VGSQIKVEPKVEPQEAPLTVARSLTDTQLRKLKVTGERYELPDPGSPGLALRISAKGQKTWTVVYRVRGAGEASGERVARLAGDKRRRWFGASAYGRCGWRRRLPPPAARRERPSALSA